jgi:hypothetical protein
MGCGIRVGRAKLRANPDNLSGKQIVNRSKPRRPEQALQIQIAQALPRFLKPEVLFYHCPNGGYRTPREAAIFRAMGVRAGVADLCFVVPPGKAVFVELKAPKGQLTQSQKDFAMAATVAGAVYGTAKSLEDVLGLLDTVGALKVRLA